MQLTVNNLCAIHYLLSASKIVMMAFPEQKLARMNGILQSFTGFGMLVGPILGSLLFNLGGFQLPFYTVGVLLLVLAAINQYVIPPELEAQCGYKRMDTSVTGSEISRNSESRPLG